MRYIYGLCDPASNELRYVGVTKNPEQRYRLHITNTRKTNSHVGHWINKLCECGTRPSMFIIEEVEDSSWVESEKFWISYFRHIGCDLTNSCDGGLGSTNPSEYTRMKMSVAKKGKPLSEEHKKKLIPHLIGNKHTLGFKHTEESKNKIGEASRRRIRKKGVYHTSQNTKDKLRVAMTGKKRSDETRKKLSESIKASYTPELRKLRSEQGKLRRGKPGHPMSNESKMKISIANRGNKSKTGQSNSPESRKRQSETMKEIWAKKKLANAEKYLIINSEHGSKERLGQNARTLIITECKT